MNILLIEDEEHKAARLEEFLKRNFIEPNIVLATSIKEAMDVLQRNTYMADVILLDMSLPIFSYSIKESGFQHNSYGGQDLLEHLDLNDNTVPVIIVTAFDQFGSEMNAVSLEELSEKYGRDFPQQYFGAVLYSPIDDNWQDPLVTLLKKALNR